MTWFWYVGFPASLLRMTKRERGVGKSFWFRQIIWGALRQPLYVISILRPKGVKNPASRSKTDRNLRRRLAVRIWWRHPSKNAIARGEGNVWPKPIHFYVTPDIMLTSSAQTGMILDIMLTSEGSSSGVNHHLVVTRVELFTFIADIILLSTQKFESGRQETNSRPRLLYSSDSTHPEEGSATSSRDSEARNCRYSYSTLSPLCWYCRHIFHGGRMGSAD